MAKSLKDKVASRLAELERNPFEAARIGGLERSFVNDILIGKKTSVRGANLSRLAVGLDAEEAYFLDAPPKAARARVMGQIGAGAEISPEMEQVPEDGLFEIESAIPLPDDAIGFEVVGNSMWPRYDPRDVIICKAAGVPVGDIPRGEEAAVRTVDGRRYLKRLLPGKKRGTFNLESHNADTIRDVKIEWASDIWTIVRASKWRRLTNAERGRVVRRAAAKARA